MWGAFWGNLASPEAKELPVCARFRLLERTVLQTFLYRAARWPPQKVIAEEVNRVQRAMYAIILGLKPYPYEEAVRFNSRRHQHAGRRAVL